MTERALDIYAGLPRCPHHGTWLKLHDTDDHFNFWFCLAPDDNCRGLWQLPRRHWTVMSDDTLAHPINPQ